MAKRKTVEDEFATSAVVIRIKRHCAMEKNNSTHLAMSHDPNDRCSDRVILEGSCRPSIVSSNEDEESLRIRGGSVEKVEAYNCNIHDRGRGGTTNSSKHRVDTSPVDLKSSEPNIFLSKAPPPHEIEEFFAAAEKDLLRKFTAKYNYDFAKDVPLDGRYEWVHVKP